VARSISSATVRRPFHEPLYDVDPRTGDSIEIFYADEVLAKSFGTRAGYFWWRCQPRFLPDCPPKGPFAISYLAYRHAASRWFDAERMPGVSVLRGGRPSPLRLPVETRRRTL
jgi:hypothetical protein